MFLRFGKMPRVLRVLVLLLLVDGVWRIVAWLAKQAAGEQPRWSMLGTGIVFVYAAVQMCRGRRDGLDLLLLHNVVLLCMIGYGAARSGTMPSSWVLATLALLVAMTAYLAWCRFRLPWHPSGSFGHWMSDPGYRAEIRDWFEERDRLVEQDRQDPPDPDELVAELMGKGDFELVKQRLYAQSERSGMAVLRALGDARYRRDPEVLALLVELLPEVLHARAVPQLQQCLPHLEGYDRGVVLRTIAATGDDSLGPLLRRELSGEQAGMVAEGLDRAVVADRLRQGLWSEVEPALREACRGPEAERAVVVLGRRDATFVRACLDAAFDLRDDAMGQVSALVDAEVELPTELALALWRHARAKAKWHWCGRLLPGIRVPDEELRQLLLELPAHFDESENEDRADPGERARWCYERVLKVLFERRGAEVEPLLHEAVRMHRAHVSPTAAELLARLRGVPEGWGIDGEPTTEPQRLLDSIGFASSYACNGGIVHAFQCLSPEQMALLERALEAIAPPSVRRPWLDALRTVSSEPLPTDEEQRTELLMSRYDDVHGRLEELSSQFFRHTWELDVAMCMYAIEHVHELGGRA